MFWCVNCGESSPSTVVESMDISPTIHVRLETIQGKKKSSILELKVSNVYRVVQESNILHVKKLHIVRLPLKVITVSSR